ncbi:hydantoinase/oxoprolinase family protein [Rhodothermus profundi]|uniref:N-methylhydantoinase A n=1 Tax=Rhodothermus profundi TaxID=633813 RepID=A0A1M6WG36_9BACT|nr:hydantoinase/oxoprolinase family protein [Rhodothermus profundi]SHK92609.1 N-methylhydantoinase A [Rhodothermus profundi]
MSIRVGIDIGGTFTDFVVFDEDQGRLTTFKVFSTPDDPARAVLEGLAQVPEVARQIVHGSTVATNALLERKGARTAFVTTAGFRDLLHIGRQHRAALYDLAARKPEPLVPRPLCFEVPERVGPDGSVLVPLHDAAIPSLIEALRRARVESVAICFLFAFANPAHEQQLARALRAAGFTVAASSDILPAFREYERASTTVASAYVAPVLDRYLGRLEAALGASLRVMQSSGGLIHAREARAQAVRCVLSGPAGGLIGARFVAGLAGVRHLITFDMGGTSTDVALVPDALPLTTEGTIGGLPISIPLLDIHTVGAGGGSLARVDPGGALRVGPESAGADPGPVCYGRGGTEPTVTDAHLVLGRLRPETFLGGQHRLDAEAAQEALTRLAYRLRLEASGPLTPAQVAAQGIIAIAEAHMARALRVISVERGYDPRDFVLVSFGGAGGLHAATLARALGIRRVLVPAQASVLSALGMLAADVVRDYVQTVMLPGTTPLRELRRRFRLLVQQGSDQLRAEGFAPDQIQIEQLLDVRYPGQSYELTVPFRRDWARAFHRLHQQRYGYAAPEQVPEIVNLRVRATGPVAPPVLPTVASGDLEPPAEALLDTGPVVLETTRAIVPFFDATRLRAGNRLTGPAVLVRPDTTVYLPPEAIAHIDRFGNVWIES